MMNEKTVLCGANSYTQKYYFNEEFSKLPDSIKQELKILCVLYVEDVGGILTLEFDENGNLELRVESDEGDYLFDTGHAGDSCTDGRRNRPAISCHLCGTGVRHGLHGNGKRKGSVL